MDGGTRMARLSLMALLGVLPLVLSTRVEDVFMAPWRAALWVFLVPALAVGGWAFLKGTRKPALTWATAPWLLFWLWALAGVFRSDNPQDSLRRGLELLGSVTCLWLGREFFRERSRAVSLILWATSLTSIYGICQALGLEPLPWNTRFGARPFGTLANPDFYAGHLLLVMPLAVALFARGGANAGWTAAAAALAATGFILSQVRGAWLAGVATAGFMGAWIVASGMLRDDARRRIKRMAAGLAVIGVVAFATWPDLRARVGSIVAVKGYDATGRRFLWEVAALIWRDHPVAGVGLDGFKFRFPTYQHIGVAMHLPNFRSYNYSEHAHNELLQFGAELGLIGVALFLWGLGAWALGWFRRMRELKAAGDEREWWMELGIGTALVGPLAYSLVNLPFQIVPTAVAWWTLMGISLGRGAERGGGAELPRVVVAPAAVAMVLAGVAGAYIAFTDLPGGGYFRDLRSWGERGNWEAAKYYGSRATRLLPWDYRAFRWLTRIGIASKDPALAEACIAVRLKLHPYLLDAENDRGDLARSMGDNVKAEAVYRALLGRAPNYGPVWSEVGAICFERRDYAGAAEAFGKAAYYQEGNAAGHHNQASALGMLKRYKEALEADQRAIAADPRFVDAYVGIALTERALKHYPEALAAAQKAYELNPQDPRTLTLLRQLQ